VIYLHTPLAIGCTRKYRSILHPHVYARNTIVFIHVIYIAFSSLLCDRTGPRCVAPRRRAMQGCVRSAHDYLNKMRRYASIARRFARSKAFSAPLSDARLTPSAHGGTGEGRKGRTARIIYSRNKCVVDEENDSCECPGCCWLLLLAAACRCVPNRAGQPELFSSFASKESPQRGERFMRLNGHADLEEHAPLCCCALCLPARPTQLCV